MHVKARHLEGLRSRPHKRHWDARTREIMAAGERAIRRMERLQFWSQWFARLFVVGFYAFVSVSDGHIHTTAGYCWLVVRLVLVYLYIWLLTHKRTPLVFKGARKLFGYLHRAEFWRYFKRRIEHGEL